MSIVKTIELKENQRAYTFPNGDKIVLNDVIELGFGSSGTHRLKTADGKLHIVASGWIHIEVTAEDWTL